MQCTGFVFFISLDFVLGRHLFEGHLGLACLISEWVINTHMAGVFGTICVWTCMFNKRETRKVTTVVAPSPSPSLPPFPRRRRPRPRPHQRLVIHTHKYS